VRHVNEEDSPPPNIARLSLPSLFKNTSSFAISSHVEGASNQASRSRLSNAVESTSFVMGRPGGGRTAHVWDG
jgi:hypothetical protein